ncbi:ankyrin repeat domain-containing protein [Wolbachia endosymbiont (group A) of Lypha dubia]|uniref:ankyrin repeat domain-containing protein n=1 Tax=Wolbachia endosymbiont (group A) of Lypha dubia TaxID=3066146 RepID=UPI003340D179
MNKHLRRILRATSSPGPSIIPSGKAIVIGLIICIVLWVIGLFASYDKELKLVNTKASENYEETLRVAAESCSLEVVKFLVRNVVDVDAGGKWGVTALHYTAQKNCLEVMRFLIAEGANINATDGFRWTPLHRAAKYGSLGAVKLLLEKGANPNAKNKDSATPLNMARNNKRYNKQYQDYVEIIRYRFYCQQII